MTSLRSTLSVSVRVTLTQCNRRNSSLETMCKIQTSIYVYSEVWGGKMVSCLFTFSNTRLLPTTSSRSSMLFLAQVNIVNREHSYSWSVIEKLNTHYLPWPCAAHKLKKIFPSGIFKCHLHYITVWFSLSLGLKAFRAAVPLADYEAQPAPSSSRGNPGALPYPVPPGHTWCLPSQSPDRCSGSLPWRRVPLHILSQGGNVEKMD